MITNILKCWKIRDIEMLQQRTFVVHTNKSEDKMETQKESLVLETTLQLKQCAKFAYM